MSAVVVTGAGVVPPIGPGEANGGSGRPKLKTAAPLVPLLLTVALDPGERVVVVPTAIVAAEPVAPVGPVAPVDPVNPFGIPRLSVWFGAVPVTLAVAGELGGNVDTVPLVREFTGIVRLRTW